ncbi:MAG: hypothetical protein M3441_20820 [Chloroflexota bacterium]|nr:hypothetical protein [Chloroflexota bacterium]
MDDDLKREIDEVLQRGKAVELIHYKMLTELPAEAIGAWEKHFAATHLLYILCDRLAKGTPEESMVQEILDGYRQFGKPYHQEPRPRF